MSASLVPAARATRLMLAGIVVAATGCDHYQARCSVSDPVLEIEGPPQSIFRLVEEPGGRVLASWIEVEITDGGPPTLRKAARAALDATGSGAPAVERIDLPARLADRRGSTSSTGVDWLPRFTLVRWVETTASTDPDGTPHSHAAAVLAVRAGGTEASLEPADARCDDCVMTLSSARAGDEALVVVTTTPAPTTGGLGGGPPKPSTSRLLRFARDGALESTRTLDLAPASVVEEAGDVFLFTPGTTLVVDRDLERHAGPFPPVAAGSFIRWDGHEAALATPRAQTRGVGEPDVMLSRLDERGGRLSGPLRFTEGALVSGVARLGRGHVAVVRSTEGLFGAEIDEAGRKVGADFPIRAPATSTQLVLARIGDHAAVLHVVTGARVTRQEISCAP